MDRRLGVVAGGMLAGAKVVCGIDGDPAHHSPFRTPAQPPKPS